MNFGDRFAGYQSMDSSGYGMTGFGGGFMEEGSPSLDASQSTKGSKNKNLSLIPCTIAMLHKAEYNQHSDTSTFDGFEIHQVTFVGIIREVDEAATNIMYKINDMTGPSIVVRKWVDTDETHLDRTRRSECREKTYVRVLGNLQYFQGKPSVIAFCVTPITDFNEISFHMLDVVYSYLSLTKPKAMSPRTNVQRTPSSIIGNSTSSFGGVNDGIGGVERQILNAIGGCTADEGISSMELKQKFRNLNEMQIRKAVEFLSNEGHIYSTIDDDHFRSTAA